MSMATSSGPRAASVIIWRVGVAPALSITYAWVVVVVIAVLVVIVALCAIPVGSVTGICKLLVSAD